ncbi:RNI-like protein [Ramaria rubella]|nr:RNI-like protein [Ramaria rubella]
MQSTVGSHDPMPLTTDDSSQGTQFSFRSRSDSLDIFTMSPLGTPPFDACPSAKEHPSAPQLRLPDPPLMSLDLDPIVAHDGDAENSYHSLPSLSTPNSPTSFSFSPPRRADYQKHYGDAPYPLEQQYGSIYGGTSYSTDMTSLIGSWDEEVRGADFPESLTRCAKGKGAEQGDFINPNSFVESSSSKGKGKAVAIPTTVPSSPHTPFEFDFDPRHMHNFDRGLKTTDNEEDIAVSPVVRLSPGSRYSQFGQDTDMYAGPSSQNEQIHTPLTEEDEEPVWSSSDPNTDGQVLSTASSRPISPVRPSALSPFHSMNGVSHHGHLPTHRRSFSSLSLRSIRSSSSRSMASIRGTFTPEGLRGKVKFMAPTAKKLKGGIRKILNRNSGRAEVDLPDSSDDEHEIDDEEVPSGGKQSYEQSRRPQKLWTQSDPCGAGYAHQQGVGHILEASSDSHATVKHAAACSTTDVPEAFNEERAVVATKSRGISEPTPFVTPVSESEIIVSNDDSDAKQVTTKPSVTTLPNHFNDILPRELQLAVLRALVDLHEESHLRAVRGDHQDYVWSAGTASKTRWVGRDRGFRELVKFSRVSKAWQDLTFDGQLWNALRITSSPQHLSVALLLRLAEYAGSFVHSLDLRGWTHLDPVTLRTLVRSLSLTPAIDVALGPEPTASTASSLFPPTNLTHISLRTCASLTTHSVHHVLLRAPELRSVDLRGLTAVTNTTCSVLSAYCPRLEIVDLGRCANLEGDGLKELVGGGTLSSSWASEEVLRASGVKRLSEEVLTALGRGAPNLEVLDISGARDLTDEAMEAFVRWDNAWDTPSSETSCYRKVELNAREMGRDPTAEFGPFFKRITRLRHLNLSSCFLLTDITCTHLAHCVPQLEFLELAGIGQELKDDGLVRLLGTTPFIRRLDLEDASDITDAIIEVLTTSPHPEIRRRGVREPPPPAPGRNLEHLIMSYAHSITNEALLTLIRGCRRLTVLECDNTRISGAVLKEFVKLARQRKLHGAEVVAVDCRSVSEALVKDLADSGQTRTRKGYRHYEALMLDYVDARDEESLGVLGGMDVDECDDSRVALKSFWSWQGVDAIQQAREKRRKLAARRNTDTGVLGDVLRGVLSDDDDDILGLGGAGPSSRPRWLTQWTRTSGSGPSSPTSMNDEERGCTLM